MFCFSSLFLFPNRRKTSIILSSNFFLVEFCNGNLAFRLCVFCYFFTGNGVQMQRDVQCCMLYSQGKVRTKDVLRFEVQTEGPYCSINAIMQVFQLSIPSTKQHTAICNLQA